MRVGREINRLSARTVQTITETGRHGDGDGLYLVVAPDGAKRWVLLFQLRGRRREMGLGPLRTTTLAQARQAAQDAREVIRQGKDPIEVRKVPEGIPTFAAASEALIATLAPGWRGAKTEESWRRSLITHAATIGRMSVDQITTEDVLRVVKPYWVSKPESGAKLRERIERVLDAETARGTRAGANPARWKSHLALMLPKRQKLVRGHHRALPYAEVRKFVARLRQSPSMGAAALEWTILTVSREDMTLAAEWKEIKGDLWTIPGLRMKEGKPHRVPLSDAALAVLERVRPIKGKAAGLIFPSTITGGKMSNATMDRLLERWKVDSTPHGFRSTFRDWAGDCTDHAREVVEAALAHQVGDDVERAYRRGDALEKRRLLMADWAAFLTTPSAAGD